MLLFYRLPGDKPRLEMEVPGLNPGSEYKFRVTACNDEGDSDPLETDRGIIAKNPFGKLVGFMYKYEMS